MLDLYDKKWKAEANPSCEMCEGYGLARYQCRPGGCFDTGVEIAPCRRCFESDYETWQSENSSNFEYFGD